MEGNSLFMNIIYFLVVPVLVPLVVSFLVNVWIEPKKEKIRGYNEKIDNLILRLETICNKSITYWSNSGRIVDVEAELKLGRISCHRQLLEINEGKNLSDYSFIEQNILNYFYKITSDDFETQLRDVNEEKIESISLDFNNLAYLLNQKKIQFRVWNFLFESINL